MGSDTDVLSESVSEVLRDGQASAQHADAQQRALVLQELATLGSTVNQAVRKECSRPPDQVRPTCILRLLDDYTDSVQRRVERECASRESTHDTLFENLRSEVGATTPSV